MRILEGLPGVSPHLHSDLTKCPTCEQTGIVEDIIKHILRCADSGSCHAAHRKLALALWDPLREAGATKHDSCWKLAGLRPGVADRPGDVIWKDFYGEGRHLVIDCCCASVRREAVQLHFDEPGFAVRAAESRSSTMMPCLADVFGQMGTFYFRLWWRIMVVALEAYWRLWRLTVLSSEAVGPTRVILKN